MTLGLEIACGLCSVGQVTLTRLAATSASDEYGRPISSKTETAFELLEPIGAEHLESEVRDDDRRQRIDHWRFWLIPQEGQEPKIFDELTWKGCCFQVTEAKPVLRPCCHTQKLHHWEVKASSVRG